MNSQNEEIYGYYITKYITDTVYVFIPYFSVIYTLRPRTVD